jgi:hypothetical protein
MCVILGHPSMLGAAQRMSFAFQIVLVKPERFPPARALAPTAVMLYLGLRRLGKPVRIESNAFLHDGGNIVVGAHLLDPAAASTLPERTVIYNTEPVCNRVRDLDAVLPFAKRFSVWDYSARNADAIVRAVPDARVRVVEPGYLPEMTRVEHRATKDIDVLFYGQQSEGRQAILDALRRSGMSVRQLDNTYDLDLDPWLGRTKLVLALHFEPGTPFALGRVVHCLSNHCAMVVEHDPGDDVPADLAPGLALADRSRIVDVCRRLVEDDEARRELAARGFACIERRDFTASLRAAIAAETAFC